MQPIFNVDAAKEAIDQMIREGGYYTPVGGTMEAEFEIAGSIADKIRGDEQDVKRERRRRDAEHQAAYESGDENRARELVREAAIAAGYNPLQLYHGTGKFGFTKVDTSKSDDGISFFTTTNARTAESYSGESKIRRTGDRSSITVDELLGADADTLLSLLRKHVDNRYEAVSEEEKSELCAEENDALKSALAEAYAYERNHVESFRANADARQAIANITDAIAKMIKAQREGDVIRAKLAYENAFADLRFADDELSWELASTINRDVVAASERKNQYLHGFMFKIPGQPNEQYTLYDDAINEVYSKLFKGIYELYGRTENMLEVDAEGRNWNQLDGEAIERYGMVRTRDYAQYAKTNGYDGVHFKNIRDSGGQTAYNGESDVYTFFNPNDIKSADPFTFDDEGKLIPLSERFNRAEEDIRYSPRNGSREKRNEQDESNDVRYSPRDFEQAYKSSGKSFSTWCKDVENMTDEEYRELHQSTPLIMVRKNTPAILQKYGAKDLPMVIRLDALYLAFRSNGVQEGHYHVLGAKNMENIIAQLEDPDVILTSDDGRLKALVSVNIKRGQAMASIELDTQKEYEGKYEAVNLVVTVFDYKMQYLKGLFTKRDAKVLYEKETLPQVNPQLHEWLSIINESVSAKRVSQIEGFVKPAEDIKRQLRDPYEVSEHNLQP